MEMLQHKNSYPGVIEFTILVDSFLNIITILSVYLIYAEDS